MAALQRVLAERSLREAPEAFQVQQLVALRQAQEASLAAWGFACEEDLAAVARLDWETGKWEAKQSHARNHVEGDAPRNASTCTL